MYPGAYATTTPDKAAVIVAETGAVVTFAELEANSIRIARVLYELGLRRGDNLAVLATNNVQVFDIYWAAMRSGVYLTMVNWHLTAPEGRTLSRIVTRRWSSSIRHCRNWRRHWPISFRRR